MLESKFGSPRIVNDGVTVAKEVELEDPVENIGAKLVRQVGRLPAVEQIPIIFLGNSYKICNRHAQAWLQPSIRLLLSASHRKLLWDMEPLA